MFSAVGGFVVAVMRLVQLESLLDHVLLFVSAVARTHQTSVTVNSCRVRKWGRQVRFLSWGVFGRSVTSSGHWGCNIWCFGRFGDLIFDMLKLVDERDGWRLR
jgi:hypothetical protein